jgi:DNA-binding response OmpR family regulator
MGSTETSKAPPRKKSILVVEDDETTRTLIVRALSAIYEVHDAIDGHAASELLEKLSPPDVIICDLMMPNMDGVELAKKVKATSSPLKRVPILMLTAKNDAQSKIKGISAGARHYMTKPFSVKELMDRVAKMVAE